MASASASAPALALAPVPALTPAPDPAEIPQLVPPPGPYLLRVWRSGDRMKPARLKGRSRKLSDLYIDAKIPRDARAAARVLVRITTGAIVWAEHVGLRMRSRPSWLPIGAEPPRSRGSF